MITKAFILLIFCVWQRLSFTTCHTRLFKVTYFPCRPHAKVKYLLLQMNTICFQNCYTKYKDLCSSNCNWILYTMETSWSWNQLNNWKTDPDGNNCCRIDVLDVIHNNCSYFVKLTSILIANLFLDYVKKQYWLVFHCQEIFKFQWPHHVQTWPHQLNILSTFRSIFKDMFKDKLLSIFETCCSKTTFQDQKLLVVRLVW
jgi:hypothetical protein